jgi:hypothetical protein
MSTRARTLGLACVMVATSACTSDARGVQRRTDAFGVELVRVSERAVEAAPAWSVSDAPQGRFVLALPTAATTTSASPTNRAPTASDARSPGAQAIAPAAISAVRFGNEHALHVVTGPPVRVLELDRRSGAVRPRGAAGRGVGEYVDPTMLETSMRDLLVIFDAPLRRLTFFGADGSTSATVLQPHDGGPLLPWHVLADGSLLARGVRETIAVASPSGAARDSEVVVRLSASGQILDAFGTWPAADLLLTWQADSSVLVQEAPNARRLLLAGNDSVVVIAPGGPWRVALHDRRGRRRRMIRVETRSRGRPEDWPMIDQLLLDDAARLWMRETPVADGVARQWVVFSLAGAPLGRVAFDAAFTLHAVRGDDVVGVWRHGDGRSEVRVLRVTP